jgi:hypothetical protein
LDLSHTPYTPHTLLGIRYYTPSKIIGAHPREGGSTPTVKLG